MTPWLRNEYILKGLFLGLWVFFALQVPEESARAWADIAWVLGWVCLGLAVGIVLGAALQISRGLRPWQNWLAFPLLVLLESPTFIYGGVMIGLAMGDLSGREFAQPWAGPIASAFGLNFEDLKHRPPVSDWLAYCVVGGSVLGFGLYRLREVEDRSWRFWSGMAVAALMVYLSGEYIPLVPGLEEPGSRFYLGVYLLLGLPFFYLLTFCGEAEESEVEVMTFCATLGSALALLGYANRFPGIGPYIAYLVPVALYFVYVTRVMGPLNVYKHILRGYTYMNLGRLRLSIQFLTRALELDPNNTRARQGTLALHNSLTVTKIDTDPELVNLLDFTICLDRAAGLLMSPPTSQQLAEADQFLHLVEQKQRAYLAKVDYLRVIYNLHTKQFDVAADTLARLLNPETPGYHPAVRRSVLYDSWDLALRGHPRLVERLGWNELNKPGRRMEAIAAVERRLAAVPDDAIAVNYRQALYPQLSEGEFIAAIGTDAAPPKEFAYEYVEQLGLALVDNANPDDRDRGMDFLRIAARGLPQHGPGLFWKLAQVYEKQGDTENMRKCLETAKKVGQAYGAASFEKDQKKCYYDALRKLAELAEQRGDFEVAIEELRLYLADGGTAALESYRKMAELFGKQLHDSINAILMTETGLTYSSTDADLLAKKDSYYYSVEPERLEQVKDRVVKWFDVSYCLRKATTVLSSKDCSLELLDWAAHLAKLAKVMNPNGNSVRLVEARVHLRRGDRDAALQILEDIFYPKQKGSGEEEDAWYAATKLLGQIYLDELNKPENALHCFVAYKDYLKSGADTLYQIARSYEGMGNTAEALKFYKAVTGYEGHPLYWDAKQAITRIKGE